MADAEPTSTTIAGDHVLAEFIAPDGSKPLPRIDLPLGVTTAQLNDLLNELLQNEEALPYSFYIEGLEILESLKATVEDQKISTEKLLAISYQPQALFRVRGITRCTSSLPGHSEAILSATFNPEGTLIASGSGDATVRVWDVLTETPKFTLKGHKSWVLCTAWAPDGRKIASGSRDNDIRVWCPFTGKMLGKPLKGHKKWINGLAFEPLHLSPHCGRLVTVSKDSQTRIWDITRSHCVTTLASHTASVQCVRWGGDGYIYTGSQDRTINMFDASNGKLCRSMSGHAHWVNHLALNSDAILRTGACDPVERAKQRGAETADEQLKREFEEDSEGAAQLRAEKAKERYHEFRATNSELLASGSDDHTCYLWDPQRSKKPVMRLTGHQQPINQVAFSPDARYLASASFDGSIRIWDGRSGKFMSTMRGHVGAVYQVCWSSDSRLIVSGSKDSTMKVWSLKSKKVLHNLPGHADEVFTVDWSPDGLRVVSGSKDCLLKVWRA